MKDRRSPGAHFVIFGPQKVGKSSFGYSLFPEGTRTAWYRGSPGTDPVSLFLSVLSKLDAAFTPAERTEIEQQTINIGGGHIPAQLGTTVGITTKNITVANQPLDVDFFLNRLRQHESEIDAIVIEEFDKIQNQEVHQQIVAVMKGLSDAASTINVIVIGIADSDRDLIRDPGYIDLLNTSVTSVKISPLTVGDLLDVFARRKVIFNVTIPDDIQRKVVWMSCGYPATLHLLSYQMCAIAWIRAGWRVTLEWLGRVAEDPRSRWNPMRYLSPAADTKVDDAKVDLKRIGMSVQTDDLIASVNAFISNMGNNFPDLAGTWQALDKDGRQFLIDYANGRQTVWDRDVSRAGGEVLARFPTLFRKDGCGAVVSSIANLYPFLRAQRYLVDQRSSRSDS